jgi:hypothetical protein
MLAVVPGTASAAQSSTSIQILSQAHLLQPSGIVLVTVNYSCGPTLAPEGTMTVGVEQPTGKFGTSGGQTAICDDVKHKLVAEVIPTGAGFAPGSASAIVKITNGAISNQTAQAEINIK